MNRYVSFDSEEYKAMRRERRIHVLPSFKGARAVDVVFETHRCVVKEKTLSNSIAVARKWVHDLMRHSDNVPSNWRYQSCATISPISAEKARSLREHGKYAFDPDQARADYKMIAAACYEIIGYCDDAQVRLQAAHVLQSIGSRAEDVQ